ncbi:MAG: RagB/SusD family nutrient uptake outer membrane protein, partial [Candidatus Cryptobacteroides sp.]
MKNTAIKIFATLALAAACAACSLDQYPHVETTSKDVYVSAANYEAVLSGIYSSLIVNLSDISSDDRLQNYTRALIMFQEATTDNLDNVWAAGESTVDLNNLSWTASDSWVSAIWYHIYNIVSLSNELIRNASDSYIDRFSEEERARIIRYRNEARGLRALAYCHAIDLFPAVSFVDENSVVGSYIPPVYDRKQLFAYLESELKDLQNLLPATCYGHFTSPAASALLARLYLNAEVYTGEPKYDECIAACQNVFNAGFSLENDYHKLFNADNHLRTNEIIFSLACDATHTAAWGAGTYLVCATRFDNYVDILKDFGVSAYWNCIRTRRELVNKFEDADCRGRFISRDRIFYDPENTDYYADEGDLTYMYRDRDVNIAAHDETATGYLITKWSNLTDAGEPSSDTGVSGADTDFPMLRLAEVNLIFAEAVL